MIWVKRSGIALLAIVALFVLLIAYVTFFVDPNDFKDKLQNIAKEQANIELRLDGNISWSFFPWLGVELEDIGVAFAGEEEIVEFGKAEFGLELLPLLSKTIRIDTVKLIDLKANLVVDKKGNANWVNKTPSNQSASLPEEQSTTKTTAEATTRTQSQQTGANATTSSKSGTTIPAIHLSLLSIENAQVSYADNTSDLLLTSTIDLTLKDVEWGKSWPLALSVELLQSSLAKSPSEKNLEQTKVQANLSGDITISAAEQTFTLENLVIENKVSADFLPVSPLASKLGITQLDVDLTQETVSLTALSLSSLGINLHIDASAEEIISNPTFNASVALKNFKPTSLFKELKLDPLKTSDVTVLQSMDANFKIKGNTQKVSLADFKLNFDDSSLIANADITLTPLSWKADIKGQNIDVDRYLPPESKEDKNTKANTATAAIEVNAAATESQTELIPTELVRSLNGQIDFNWSNFKIANLTIDKITLSSTQKNGFVTVKPLSASLYQGSMGLEATLDARSSTPKIMLKPNIQDIQLKPLVKDLTEKEKITGVTDLKGKITTQGNQIDTLIKNTNGDLLVQILDGALLGTNLTKSVCEGIAKHRNESLDQNLWTEDTPFESMNFPAKIRNGEISTPGLKIQAVGINVKGDGLVSLPTSSFNYKTSIGLIGSNVDKACRIKEEFKTLAFPVICKGKFSDEPASLCRPDLKGFAKQFENLAKAKLKIKADAEKARAKKKLKEKAKKEAERLKKRLKSLF